MTETELYTLTTRIGTILHGVVDTWDGLSLYDLSGTITPLTIYGEIVTLEAHALQHIGYTNLIGGVLVDPETKDLLSLSTYQKQPHDHPKVMETFLKYHHPQLWQDLQNIHSQLPKRIVGECLPESTKDKILEIYGLDKTEPSKIKITGELKNNHSISSMLSVIIKVDTDEDVTWIEGTPDPEIVKKYPNILNNHQKSVHLPSGKISYRPRSLRALLQRHRHAVLGMLLQEAEYTGIKEDINAILSKHLSPEHPKTTLLIPLGY